MSTEKSEPASDHGCGDDRAHDCDRELHATGDSVDLSRRNFLGGAAIGATAATALGPGLVSEALAHRGGPPEFGHSSRDRILLKGGIILSMDPNVGDFEEADVLIQGKKILEVKPRIKANARVIDCKGMIVMPGFVNTHIHMFQTNLRGMWSDALSPDYGAQSRAAPGAIFHQYRPEDVYLGDYVGALDHINAGITTAVDTSQSSYSPEHTDAGIRGFLDSGLRTVFAFSGTSGGNAPRPDYAFPNDIHRLKKRFFASDDQLVTLAVGTGAVKAHWELAREVGVPIFVHLGGAAGALLEALAREGLAKDDTTYIHCTSLNNSAWDVIKSTGGQVSISVIVEQTLHSGMLALQAALDRGILPSFSTDAVSLGTAEFFSQMRAAFVLQRSRIQERQFAGETNLPRVVSCREILEMATMGGARGAHLADKVGSLTPGKEADIILLNAERVNTAPVIHAAGAVVSHMDTSNVDTVFIGGKVRKWKGELVGVNTQSVLRRINSSAKRLLAASNYPNILLTTCCAR